MGWKHVQCSNLSRILDFPSSPADFSFPQQHRQDPPQTYAPSTRLSLWTAGIAVSAGRGDEVGLIVLEFVFLVLSVLLPLALLVMLLVLWSVPMAARSQEPGLAHRPWSVGGSSSSARARVAHQRLNAPRWTRFTPEIPHEGTMRARM